MSVEWIELNKMATWMCVYVFKAAISNKSLWFIWSMIVVYNGLPVFLSQLSWFHHQQTDWLLLNAHSHIHTHSHSQLHKVCTYSWNNRARTGWGKERKKKVSRLNPHIGTFHIQVTNHVSDVYTTAGKNSSLIHTQMHRIHIACACICVCVWLFWLYLYVRACIHITLSLLIDAQMHRVKMSNTTSTHREWWCNPYEYERLGQMTINTNQF